MMTTMATGWRRARGMRTRVAATAGKEVPPRDPYEALGVSREASLKDIKRAFRQKALKYHPDVNDAPDAQEQFMAYKRAYKTLSDKQKREEYDRSSRWRGTGAETGRRATTSRTQEEPFYGLGDFFADLDKEIAAYAEKRKKKRGGNKETTGTLWEELAELGEEFVEFLEEAAGVAEASKDDGSDDPWDRFEKVYQRYADDDNRSTPKKRPPSPTRKTKEEETESIDEMLEKLKRDMGM
eukprot:scaffold324_cov326-Pavlova_lutheri.AAC.70